MFAGCVGVVAAAAAAGLYLSPLRCTAYFQNYKNTILRAEFAAILGEMTCVFR